MEELAARSYSRCRSGYYTSAWRLTRLGNTSRSSTHYSEADIAPSTLRDLLTGSDRRSIGRVPLVLTRIRRAPGRAVELVAALQDTDPVVRMRAADALEKVSVGSPFLLLPHRRFLLSLARKTKQAELRWHLAQMLPRLPLTVRQRRELVRVLRGYLRDSSRIVRTMAMQGLADLAIMDTGIRRWVLPLLANLARMGTPAMRARGRRLIGSLSRPTPARSPCGLRQAATAGIRGTRGKATP